MLKTWYQSFIGHSVKNVKKSNLVKSSAIKNNNNEIKYALNKKYLFTQEQVLADVSFKKISLLPDHMEKLPPHH